MESLVSNVQLASPLPAWERLKVTRRCSPQQGLTRSFSRFPKGTANGHGSIPGNNSANIYEANSSTSLPHFPTWSCPPMTRELKCVIPCVAVVDSFPATDWLQGDKANKISSPSWLFFICLLMCNNQGNDEVWPVFKEGIWFGWNGCCCFWVNIALFFHQGYSVRVTAAAPNVEPSGPLGWENFQFYVSL